jgi:hypothetical protein
MDSLQWTQLGSKFDPRTVRRIDRIMGNLQMTTLREQVYFFPEILERELKLLITRAEFSIVVGRQGSWAYEMIAEYIHQVDPPDRLDPGRRRLVHVPLEDGAI